MTGRIAVVIAAVGATLAAPGTAAAVDHVTLFVAPTKLSPDWKLSAAVVGATSPGGRETFGISLTRTFGDGRGEEVHGLRAAPAGTIRFDGRSGRWRARLGTVAGARHDRDGDRPRAGHPASRRAAAARSRACR